MSQTTPSPTPSPAPARTPARTRVEASLVVALIGLAISVYLTVEHFTASATLACPEGAVINCAKVTSSSQSVILGIPVAVLGLAYFLAMVALLTPAAWRRRSLDPVRLLAVAAGVVMVLYLVWVELFRLDAICLWCTAVHVCTLALLGTVLWRVAERRPVDGATPTQP